LNGSWSQHYQELGTDVSKHGFCNKKKTWKQRQNCADTGKQSSVYSEITSKILEACAPLISHPLSYICTHSLHTAVFLDRLKLAVVKPLYKKGDKTSVTNYRSISLLTVFCKVFEKAMHSRLSQHLHTNNILVTQQHGFGKRISTENATFSLTDSVFISIN
jgi:hypothetical protein